MRCLLPHRVLPVLSVLCILCALLLTVWDIYDSPRVLLQKPHTNVVSGRAKLLPNDSSFACFPLDVVTASTTMTKLVPHCGVVDVDTTPESPMRAMDMILHNQTADPVRLTLSLSLNGS